MKVLIACEESQTVCVEFRRLGHEAYSSDILEPSGQHKEWHILGDSTKIIDGNCKFCTMDGETHEINGRWDLIIAHPPCTYLSNAATRSFSLKCTPAEKVIDRMEKRARAAVFFMRFIAADCKKICVENPIGFMSKAYRPPDQYIEPYMFADDEADSENFVTKKTGLWLKGLPPLKQKFFVRPNNKEIFGVLSNGKAKTWMDVVRDQKLRSKTFSGVAKAMAEHWGGVK